MLLPTDLSVGELKRIAPLTSAHCVISPPRALRDLGVKGQHTKVVEFSS